MSTPKRADAAAAPRLAGAERAALAVLAAGVLLIPTIFATGDDAFRLPKEILFRGEAIVLLAVAVFWATSPVRTWRLPRGVVLALPAIAVGWTIVSATASTNRALSVDSLLTVVAAAVIFIATCAAAPSLSLVAVDVLMVTACINAAMAILQETKLWNPFHVTVGGHYATVGLLGNPNDVGTFLVVPLLAAVVVAVTVPGLRRWIYLFMAVLLAAGIVASGTRAALGAVVAGLIVFALLHSRRVAIVTVAALIVLAIPAFLPSTVLGRRVREAISAARTQDYQVLFSERLVPFLSAIDMARARPAFGVGPGCFKYNFMEYRLALRNHYPQKWTQSWPMNFGDVHNDHLQVASETGLPGYTIFLAALAVAAGGSWRRRETSATRRAAFAHALRWPLAAAVFVLCLAQFPLEVAAARLMLLTVAALCIEWDGADAA